MPRIQIHADTHPEFLELFRVWATELPISERGRAKKVVEGAWETVADHVEITFQVDDWFLAYLSKHRFRYRKI